MPSLFHQLDTETLEQNPNLKFDPQNPSGHLNDKHPTFQQLKEGLTPTQVEILENVTQVDGFDIDEETIPEDNMEMIDPETGEAITGDDEFTLDDLGFIDPNNLRSITFEAFNTERLDHVNTMIQERYQELSSKRDQLARTGFVSKLEANNINGLLGGQLYDNVIMESFTSSPTKVNFNLVMEEVSAGQAALAAGGAIVGATILYKLVKWCLNAWNKNAVANGSIGQNVQNIQERKDRLRNGDNVIEVAQQAFNDASTKFKNETKDNSNDSAIAKALGKVSDVSQLNNQAKASEFLAEIVDANAKANLAPIYSNLWASLVTNQAVQINGGSLAVTKDFIAKMQSAAQACQEIANASSAKLEDIKTTATNATVNSSSDDTYTKAIGVIAEFAKVCAFNLPTDNFNAGASEFATHVMNNVVGKLNTPVPDKAYNAAVEIFSAETFAVISDEFMKDIEEFGKTLESTGNGKKGMFGTDIGSTKGSVNVGDDVQRDSRLKEYNKAATNFRGAMNVMRAIHAIRNNVGKGLDSLAKALAVTGAK